MRNAILTLTALSGILLVGAAQAQERDSSPLLSLAIQPGTLIIFPETAAKTIIDLGLPENHDNKNLAQVQVEEAAVRFQHPKDGKTFKKAVTVCKLIGPTEQLEKVHTIKVKGENNQFFNRKFKMMSRLFFNNENAEFLTEGGEKIQAAQFSCMFRYMRNPFGGYSPSVKEFEDIFNGGLKIQLPAAERQPNTDAQSTNVTIKHTEELADEGGCIDENSCEWPINNKAE